MECFFFLDFIMNKAIDHLVSELNLFKPTIRFILCIFALAFNTLVNASEPEKIAQRIQLLDQKTAELTNQFYQYLRQSSNQATKSIDSLQALKDILDTPAEQTSNYSNLNLIHNNLDFIHRHFESTVTPKVLKLLLEQNDPITALSLVKAIEQSGDSILAAKASIQLAEYYNGRKQWEDTLRILNIDLEELAELDASHASMARGFALQNLKRHRQAIKEYKGVYAGTAFFQSAHVNIAIAHLRQDWWTDAHIIIKQLLKPESNISTEFKDRLNLMLGYSFFNKEYYRESREAFRDVSLDSLYTNRAIMGLVLAAIAQQDYTSALKTLTLLNQKPGNELVIEETYLLLPNLYQKLGQFNKANLAYQQAISYYEQRIEQLDIITPLAIADNFAALSNQQQQTIQLAQTEFKLSTLYPEYFEQNLILLNQIIKHPASKHFKPKLDALLNEYQETFEQVSRSLVKLRVNALSSYLSQSKYGLAQLYDNTDE